MGWYDAYNASQNIAYYWGVYNIIFMLAALAVVKSSQD